MHSICSVFAVVCVRSTRESEHGEHEGPCDASDRGRLAPDETERDADLLGGRVGEDMEPHRKDGLRQPHQPNGEAVLRT